MPIKGLTDTLRMPRLGYIKSGELKEKDGKTYPSAADHFILEGAAADVFAGQVTEIEPVMIPVEEEDRFANTMLRWWTQGRGLICSGDGEIATRVVDSAALRAIPEGPEGVAALEALEPAPADTENVTRIARPCPCPHNEGDKPECGTHMALQLMLPTVPGFGIWQVNTGSKNSVMNILGTVAMLKNMAGRCSMLPLKLVLIKQTIASRRGRRTVNVLRLDLPSGMTMYDLIERARALPAPGEAGSMAMLPEATHEAVETDDALSADAMLPERDDEWPADVRPTPDMIDTARAEDERRATPIKDEDTVAAGEAAKAAGVDVSRVKEYMQSVWPGAGKLTVGWLEDVIAWIAEQGGNDGRESAQTEPEEAEASR